MLRMPSVLAGTAFCWFTYLWLKTITAARTAFLGLLLAAFSPSLIELSAEIRQYALLLFFEAACLYLAERALRRSSHACMILFSLSLYGALLTHYSALLFAFCVGIYLLVRLFPWRANLPLMITWAFGQIIALAIVAWSLLTHIPHLNQMGMGQGIAETWLRKSIYHPGENNFLLFPLQQTLRVFTYIFSHGLLGAVALIVFVAGIVWLVRQKSQTQRPSPRDLAILIILPLAANCIVAFAGLYPYGGTRHNVYLAPFAIAGIAIGVNWWQPRRNWLPAAVTVLCLVFCNLFPAPPPMIRASNHKRELMQDAIADLRQHAPPGSTLFADYQSGLLIGYYLCGHGIVEEFPPLPPYNKSGCSSYTVITTQPQVWKFYATDFAAELAGAAQTFGLAPGTTVWLFDAGWITDSAPALRKGLPGLGCTEPRIYGENILTCQLMVTP